MLDLLIDDCKSIVQTNVYRSKDDLEKDIAYLGKEYNYWYTNYGVNYFELYFRFKNYYVCLKIDTEEKTYHFTSYCRANRYALNKVNKLIKILDIEPYRT